MKKNSIHASQNLEIHNLTHNQIKAESDKNVLYSALSAFEQTLATFIVPTAHLHITTDLHHIFKSFYDVGSLYYSLGDSNKALELYKQAYFIMKISEKEYEEQLSFYLKQNVSTLTKLCLKEDVVGRESFMKYPSIRYIQDCFKGSSRFNVFKEGSQDLMKEYIKKNASGLIKYYLTLEPIEAYLKENAPEFIKNNEKREFILKRSSTNEYTLAIKEKLQTEVLNKIVKLSSKGTWSDQKSYNFYDWGVKGYLEDKYLKEQLENLYKTIEIAKMLCFEAICLGAINSKNYTCVKEFAKAYPLLIQNIVEQHSEYFVDGSIVRMCITNDKVIKRLLEEPTNYPDQGKNAPSEISLTEHNEKTIEAKIKSKFAGPTEINGVKVINPAYIYISNVIDAEKKLKEDITAALDASMKQIIIPLNLLGERWVGAEILIKEKAKIIQIHYLNSEKQKIPPILKDTLKKKIEARYPGYELNIIEQTLESLDTDNCYTRDLASESIPRIFFMLLDEEVSILGDRC